MPQEDGPGWISDQEQRIDELVDEYRRSLHDSLDGLTEQQARRRLVPSETTLLGLVQHATLVEGVWFDQAITGRGERPVWTLRLQVLRELAQHAGHADILREQITADSRQVSPPA